MNGPATWEQHSDRWITTATGREVAQVSAAMSAEEMRSTANLIAAAPDLLALAKRLASECANCGDNAVRYGPRHSPCEDCADIRAVIARAGE